MTNKKRPTKSNTKKTKSKSNSPSQSKHCAGCSLHHLGTLITIVITVIITVTLISVYLLLSHRDPEPPAPKDELKSGSASILVGDQTVTLKAAYIVDGIEKSLSSGTFASTSSDESVFLIINGGSLVIDGDVHIQKSGDCTTCKADYHGQNSAILVIGTDSSASINGATITTSGTYANALTAIDQSAVGISNSLLTTKSAHAYALYASGSGTIEADTITISTPTPNLATHESSGFISIEP